MISLDGFMCLLVGLGLPIAMFAQYWIIRLAVRGGILDATGHPHNGQ